MDFKTYECDFGVTINGVNYDFLHVVSYNVENPQRNRLTRGSNAGDSVGIAYQEGVKEAKTVTLVVMGLTVALHNLLKQVAKDATRLDQYVVNRKTGARKIAKDAVLSQEPMQLTLEDSPESMQTALVFEAFDVSEERK